jgi:alpha-mannosidase
MIHMIGNAHLDPAWMWQMSEGLEAFLATCRSALDRMDEYPDFIFTCSSAAHLEFVEQTDPKLFARIQQRAKEGRWVNVGGWWVEADCNLPSGESFIRQALLAQHFFKSRFGQSCSVGYCIDSFGHNANLPHLLKICGLENFVFMRPDDTEKEMDASLFQWLSPSGDTVNTYRIALHYSNFARTVERKLADLIEHPTFTSDHDWMIFYGVGNHGGGPTKAQIDQILKAQSSSSNIIFSSPRSFFNETPTPNATYLGDINPHAIGCYSAHSELKQLNRRAENALMEAEKLISLAESLTKFRADWSALRQGWKNVCFNQFHDILGGVAIKEACEDAIDIYREAISIAERTKRLAIQVIASQIDTRGQGEAIVVFNPKCFESEEEFTIELWHPHASELGENLEHLRVTDASGKEYPVQRSRPSGKIGGDRTRFVAKARIPALGWKTFFVERHVRSSVGELRTFNREQKVEIIDFNAARRSRPTEKFDALMHPYMPAEVYEDESDTWGHHITGFTKKIGQFTPQNIDTVEQGVIYKVHRITSTYHNSTLIEEYRQRYLGGPVDIHVSLDWREKHAVCKLRFDHLCSDVRATFEVPYAAIERAIGEQEEPGQSWVHVRGTRAEREFGMAVITDSKYSYSVNDKSIVVTVARSPLYAHHVPPHQVQPGERLDYLDQGIQDFNVRLVFNCQSWDAALLHQLSSAIHQPAIAHYESGHEGTLPQQFSSIHCSNSKLDLTLVKRAENIDGIVLRVVNRSALDEDGVITSELWEFRTNVSLRKFETKTLLIQNRQVSGISATEL